MAYKSLFQPISEQEIKDYNKSHDIQLNEFVAPQATAPAQQAPAQTPAVEAPAPATPQAQQQPAPAPATIDINAIGTLGKNIQQSCPAAAKDQALLALWNTLKAQPTADNLMAYMSAFAKFAGQQAQPAQPVAPAQPGVAPQGQPAAPAQPAQAINNSVQPRSSWKLIKEHVRYNRALREAEEAKAVNDGSDNGSSKKEAPKTSQKKDDFNDAKHVDYSGEYSEEVSGKKGETTVEYKDKIMYDSIFGSKEDPFADSKEVKYNNSYDQTGDGPTERPDNTAYTKPEPFKPENPKLTSLSDATAVNKTVFTIDDKGNVKDTGASSDKKHVQDDGSDGDVNEGFITKVPYVLSESFVDDNLKKTIIRQFINTNGETFDIEDFAAWLEDEYPGIAADPSAFDELSQAIQNGDLQEEIDDPDIDLDDDIERETPGEDDDFKSGDDYKDVAEEYVADTDLDEYDEDDAISWVEDHYPEIADDDSSLDDFLDAVCDMFTEDDINESFNDEFYASEHELKS